MNPIVKEKWLKALRSGEYKQGYGCLKNGDKFCCLGVLSDLYAKEKDAQWKDEFFSPSQDETYDSSENNVLCGREGVPPQFVIEWAEIEEPNPPVYMGYHDNSVAGYNDDGYTFIQIANIIEEQL